MIRKDKIKESDRTEQNQHPERQVNNQLNKKRDLNESATRKNKDNR